MLLLLAVVAAAARAAEECASRDGVFFSPSEFPSTGAFANQRSSPDELEARVAAWAVPYGLGPLTEAQHAQFFRDGWVIVPDLVPREALEGAIASVEALVDSIARRLYAAGKIANLHEEAGFQRRLQLIDQEFPHANVLLHKNGVLPEGIRDVWAHPRLMGVAQQLLGADADIVGHPVWNLRCKTPDTLSQGQATVPWHQDNAYLDEECWDKLQVTAWVPLVDTTKENGCMQVVNRSHRHGGTAEHACCVGGTWYVETTPEELEATVGASMSEDIVTCEVPFGSVLLLNNLIAHRSLPNYSDEIRWSLDLRWQRGGEPNGFHGLKDSVLMKRRGEEFNGTVDWGDWASQDRTTAQLEALGVAVDEAQFDTAIAGPWMNRWKLVHENRHTANIDPGGGLHGWGGGELTKPGTNKG